MLLTKKLFRRALLFICLAGFFIYITAATNARLYAMGQPAFVGDIIRSVGQGWVTLIYPDQIQGSADFTGSDGEPGPVIMTKSLGEYVAVGVTLNTFDRITGGSVLRSAGFLEGATIFVGAADTRKKFPNWPQYHLGIKLGKHKIGLDGFFETFSRFYSNKSKQINGVELTESTNEENPKVKNAGGAINGHFVFGNLAFNPYFSFGLPFIHGSRTDLSTTIDTTADTITSTSNKTDTFGMGGEKIDNRMLVVGSCLDYAFGDRAWAIIGVFYRNETYQYKYDTDSKSTVGASVVEDTSYSSLSGMYDNNFYDYFASITPFVFEDFTIGFEYRGGLITSKVDNSEGNTDTINTFIYNDALVSMEKPIQANVSWCDVLTIRGSLVYFTKKNKLERRIGDNSTIIEESPILTEDGGSIKGMQLFFGLGYKKGRICVDIGSKLMRWTQNGLTQGPPPASLTMTVDLGKGE
jgi:hypothetical protein